MLHNQTHTDMEFTQKEINDVISKCIESKSFVYKFVKEGFNVSAWIEISADYEDDEEKIAIDCNQYDRDKSIYMHIFTSLSGVRALSRGQSVEIEEYCDIDLIQD